MRVTGPVRLVTRQSATKSSLYNFLLILPALAEACVRPQEANDLKPCSQPIVPFRVVNDLMHHLHQASGFDDVRLSLSVLLGKGEEKPLFIIKVVENGSSGLAGAFF